MEELKLPVEKLTHSSIERKLGSRCTSRNWNTVLRLAALCSS